MGAMLIDKRIVVIDDLKIEYATSGMGSPAIVLVNGAGGPLESWHKLLPHIEILGTVLAYNRPGVGRSTKPVEPQTGDVVVRSLRGLLGHLRLSPPYVLVGHSLGGLYVNLYARSFPGEVTGVILLDAAAPEDAGLVSEYSTAIQRTPHMLE
jgi:pimeloyl-ACP methyl ester carboxylesterase